MRADLVAAAVLAVPGIVPFVAALFLFDRLTLGLLRKAVTEEHDTALAVLIGGVAIGMPIIIPAAVT